MRGERLGGGPSYYCHGTQKWKKEASLPYHVRWPPPIEPFWTDHGCWRTDVEQQHGWVTQPGTLVYYNRKRLKGQNVNACYFANWCHFVIWLVGYDAVQYSTVSGIERGSCLLGGSGSHHPAALSPDLWCRPPARHQAKERKKEKKRVEERMGHHLSYLPSICILILPEYTVQTCLAFLNLQPELVDLSARIIHTASHSLLLSIRSHSSSYFCHPYPDKLLRNNARHF